MGPEVASASSPLTISEARTAVAHLVRGKGTRGYGGYEPGSLIMYCNQRSSRYVSCDIYFDDSYGRDWCGHASASLVAGVVTSRMNVNGNCTDW